MKTKRASVTMRRAAHVAIGSVVGAFVACSGDSGSTPGNACSSTVEEDSQTQTITARTADGTLVRTTSLADGGSSVVSQELTLHGVPLASSKSSIQAGGALAVDAFEDGLNAHLQSANGKDWTGTLGGTALQPFHLESRAQLSTLQLRYADGRPVQSAPVDPATRGAVDGLLAALSSNGSQCTPVAGGGFRPLDAVSPAPEDTRSMQMCLDCTHGCGFQFLGCEVANAAGCLGFLAVPFIGGVLAGICEAVAFAVCTAIEFSCAASCQDGPSCCPVSCGVDGNGQKQCCEMGGTCQDFDTNACCPPDHPQTCGKGATGVCCQAQGQDACVGGDTDKPTCCPVDSEHQVCGTECCDLRTTGCANNFFVSPGQPPQTCCPFDRDCAGTCCNDGFQCNPATHTCECGGLHQPCGLNCCDVGFRCGNPQQGSCCPDNTSVCGGNCCPSIARCTTVGGQETCCPAAQSCGLICCGQGEKCGDVTTGLCCPSNVSVCGGQCCPNAGACTLLPDGTQGCCGQNGTFACGTQCCLPDQQCDPFTHTCQ